MWFGRRAPSDIREERGADWVADHLVGDGTGKLLRWGNTVPKISEHGNYAQPNRLGEPYAGWLSTGTVS